MSHLSHFPCPRDSSSSLGEAKSAAYEWGNNSKWALWDNFLCINRQYQGLLRNLGFVVRNINCATHLHNINISHILVCSNSLFPMFMHIKSGMVRKCGFNELHIFGHKLFPTLQIILVQLYLTIWIANK